MEFAGGTHGVLADVMASATNRISAGWSSRLSWPSSDIRSSSMCRRPRSGVHQDHVGGGELGFADGAARDFEETACRCLPAPGQQGWPMRPWPLLRELFAGGRSGRRSGSRRPPAGDGRGPRATSRELAGGEVVLPEPCNRPRSRQTEGGRRFEEQAPFRLPSSSSSFHRRTILSTC